MSHPQLDRLLADVDAPVRRVVFARGVEALRDGHGPWRLPAFASPTRAARRRDQPAHATLSALGLRPVGGRGTLADIDHAPADEHTAAPDAAGHVDPVRVGAQHGLAPLLLVASRAAAAGTDAGESTHVVSAAGALGWRAPLERLYDDPTVGRRALRLRFLLDAIEHHAAAAAEAYATAAGAARRTAALFGGHELTTLSGQPALFVELDALLGAAQRVYLGGARLLAAAFPPRRSRDARRAAPPPPPDLPPSFDALVLGARSAPAELRETLLTAWETHGAHAAAYRRALRRRDAAELGHAPVRLARLASGLWAVSVPVPTPPNDGALADRRVDALERAWAIATDAMRVMSHVVYAASER